MKKLILAATLIFLTSCQTESQFDDFVHVKQEQSKFNGVTAREKQEGVWEVPSENPYELDGYIHIVVGREKVNTF
jgi:hypothetical protein